VKTPAREVAGMVTSLELIDVVHIAVETKVK